MTDISYEVMGVTSASLRFEQFPENARGALTERMRGITDQLEARVLAAVPRSKGTLARLIDKFVDVSEDRIVGKVKVVTRDKNAIIKALSLEYGAHGSASVRSYHRGDGSILARLLRPTDGMVRAYHRHVNISAVEYLRGPLREVEASALAQMKQAVDQAAAK